MADQESVWLDFTLGEWFHIRLVLTGGALGDEIGS